MVIFWKKFWSNFRNFQSNFGNSFWSLKKKILNFRRISSKVLRNIITNYMNSGENQGKCGQVLKKCWMRLNFFYYASIRSLSLSAPFRYVFWYQWRYLLGPSHTLATSCELRSCVLQVIRSITHLAYGYDIAGLA